MSLPQNMIAEIGQSVGRALARHVGLKPDLQMNAQARELEATIAANVAEILEA
ncbi:MAG: hypothetical protein K8H75_14470 [Sulfuricella sp.]|nr:hypothetical protein [Sulfuricella sp.]